MSLGDLWTTAAADHESDHQRRLLIAARTQVLPLWPFLAKADSPADFANRKAIIADRIDDACTKLADGAEFAVLRNEVDASLEADFRIIHEARQAEQQRVNAPRAAMRAEARDKDPVCPNCGSAAITYSKAKLYNGKTSKCSSCGHTFDQEHAYAQASLHEASDYKIEKNDQGKHQVRVRQHPGGPGTEPMWFDAGDPADTREEAERKLEDFKKSSAVERSSDQIESGDPHPMWRKDVSENDTHASNTPEGGEHNGPRSTCPICASKTADSHYVYRKRGPRPDYGENDPPKEGWTGPIRSPNQADKEKAAWEESGWEAEVHPSSPEVKQRVRDWEKKNKTSAREGAKTAVSTDVADAAQFLRKLNVGDTVTVVIDGKDHEMKISQALQQDDFAYEGDRLVGAGSLESSGVKVTFGPGRYSTRVSVSQQASKNPGMAYIKTGSKTASLEDILQFTHPQVGYKTYQIHSMPGEWATYWPSPGNNPRVQLYRDESSSGIGSIVETVPVKDEAEAEQVIRRMLNYQGAKTAGVVLDETWSEDDKHKLLTGMAEFDKLNGEWLDGFNLGRHTAKEGSIAKAAIAAGLRGGRFESGFEAGWSDYDSPAGWRVGSKQEEQTVASLTKRLSSAFDALSAEQRLTCIAAIWPEVVASVPRDVRDAISPLVDEARHIIATSVQNPSALSAVPPLSISQASDDSSARSLAPTAHATTPAEKPIPTGKAASQPGGPTSTLKSLGSPFESRSSNEIATAVATVAVVCGAVKPMSTTSSPSTTAGHRTTTTTSSPSAPSTTLGIIAGGSNLIFEALRKGAPFAGYDSWEACIKANSSKQNPEAYCGSIKHKVEDKKSSLKTAITYGELPDTIGTGAGQPNMACANEACEEYGIPYSAERGDYFMANPSDTVTCGACGEPMSLVQVRSGVDFLSRKQLASKLAAGDSSKWHEHKVQKDKDGHFWDPSSKERFETEEDAKYNQDYWVNQRDEENKRRQGARQVTAASDIHDAVREHAEHQKGVLKPGDRVGEHTVTNVGTHTVQFTTDDGWDTSVQIPFKKHEQDEGGHWHERMLPSHERAMNASKMASKIIEMNAWADTFGNWHARVTTDGSVGAEDEAEAAALSRIRAELGQREGPNYAPDVVGLSLNHRDSQNGTLTFYYDETNAHEGVRRTAEGQTVTKYMAQVDGEDIEGPFDNSGEALDAAVAYCKVTSRPRSAAGVGRVQRPIGWQRDSTRRTAGDKPPWLDGDKKKDDAKSDAPSPDADDKDKDGKEDEGQQGADDPAQMQPGQQVTLHYTLTGSAAGSGDCPASFENFDGATATFKYEKGTFGVTNQGGKWVDSAGTEFTFSAGTATGEQQAQPQQPEQPAPGTGQPPVQSKLEMVVTLPDGSRVGTSALLASDTDLDDAVRQSAAAIKQHPRTAELHTAADEFQVGDHVRVSGGFEDGLTGVIVANEPLTDAEHREQTRGLGIDNPESISGGTGDRPYRYRIKVDGSEQTIGGLHPVNLEKVGSRVVAVQSADGKEIKEGDRVFNYYDGFFVTVGPISSDGWFDTTKDGGGRGPMLNGERVAVDVPPSNPFYDTFKQG